MSVPAQQPGAQARPLPSPRLCPGTVTGLDSFGPAPSHESQAPGALWFPLPALLMILLSDALWVEGFQSPPVLCPQSTWGAGITTRP